MREKTYAEIPFSEYRLRIDRAKKLMKKHGLDALLLFCHQNVNYFTGWRDTWFYSFLRGAVIPREGEPAMIAPGLVYHPILQFTYVEDVVLWEEANPAINPVKVVIDKLTKMGLGSKTIGLELGVGMYMTGATLAEVTGIREGLPKAKFVDASPMIWEQRRVKTSWEIEIYRKLCKIVMKGYLRGLNFCRAGVTVRDIQTEIWKSFLEDGLADSPMKGQVIMRYHSRGERTPAGCYRATDHVMKEGDMLMLDGGPALKGYETDVQRQACIGEPTKMVKELHELVRVGFNALEQILRPGIPIKETFLVPAEAMRKHKPRLQFPWKFMGHSVGLQIHEFPWLIGEEETITEPGMIFCVEIPGYDIPEWREMGSFPEDMYLITEEGFENLTVAPEFPREIFIR